jgi:hypothetical protein
MESYLLVRNAEVLRPENWLTVSNQKNAINSSAVTRKVKLRIRRSGFSKLGKYISGEDTGPRVRKKSEKYTQTVRKQSAAI